ncbi:MAG: DUF1836 domain-containing protein [Oscillospiraceae bacterium]|jgi:hypothetical protein|nr:DUF1836 domain-containing protein [Oscillospiraceae bacterium]
MDSMSRQKSDVAVGPDSKGFAKIEMLLEATGGLSLSQVCAVTGLEGTTIQNWVKRGWVEHPVGKKYEEVHIARILIINALKECIKLEHISLLMSYVNGKSQDGSEAIIKESTLYNYLCEALKQSGQTDDHSKSGVETVINNVIKDYSDPNPDSRIRIRKALTLMIFACVCTDVKRRTEAMMGQILVELENPRPVVPLPIPELVLEPIEEDEPAEVLEDIIETRKTVSQALREWDISSVERIIIDHDEEARNNAALEDDEKKQPAKPWYVRKKN